MEEQGVDRILMFPLYPQYSATTTATANDKLFRALMTMRNMPAIRSVPAYYDEPVYIEALAQSVERHLASIDFEPEVVLASYHGIPKAYFERGDPYHCHCQKTTRLLRERLGWDESKLITTFQSRFGAQEWLQPYTDKTVERLAREGVKSIAVDQSRLFIGLHRDAGGDRRRGSRNIPSCRRPEFQPHTLPERQRRWHGDDRGAGSPRACGLDLSTALETFASALIVTSANRP